MKKSINHLNKLMWCHFFNNVQSKRVLEAAKIAKMFKYKINKKNDLPDSALDFKLAVGKAFYIEV